MNKAKKRRKLPSEYTDYNKYVVDTIEKDGVAIVPGPSLKQQNLLSARQVFDIYSYTVGLMTGKHITKLPEILFFFGPVTGEREIFDSEIGELMTDGWSAIKSIITSQPSMMKPGVNFTTSKGHSYIITKAIPESRKIMTYANNYYGNSDYDVLIVIPDESHLLSSESSVTTH